VRITLFDQAGNALPAKFRALVDSGADTSMFPVALMDKLGISTSDCQTVSGRGAAGADDFLFWPGGVIKARLSRWNLELTAFFGNPAIPLLGRADFFVLFRRIVFDEQTKTFTIEK
jgi:Aspartyl protease